MKYETPELVVLGPAAVLVQGPGQGHGDNMGSDDSKPFVGILLGLDDD